MEFRSLEEFDRAFFARYGTAGDAAYGAPGGTLGMRPATHDPFLWDAAPPPAGGAASPQKPGPLQIVNSVVSYAIIALLALAIIGFVAPLPFGVKLLNVRSGSMQPYYNVNTLVWVVPTKYEKIKVGDDVTYKLPIGALSTHRVIGLDRASRTLTVQGTHNSVSSETIEYEQVQGVVRFHIHGVGGMMDTLNGESGIYIKVMLFLAVALIWGASYFLSKMKPGQLTIKRPEGRQI